MTYIEKTFETKTGVSATVWIAGEVYVRPKKNKMVVTMEGFIDINAIAQGKKALGAKEHVVDYSPDEVLNKSISDWAYDEILKITDWENAVKKSV